MLDSILDRLPSELFQQILEHLADNYRVKQLLRLRRVSKLFNEHLMSGTVFPRSTSYKDIVSCSDKALVCKYLRWYQDPTHRPKYIPSGDHDADYADEGRNLNQVFGLMKDCQDAFVVFAEGKYSYQIAQDTVHSLFAQNMITQQLQYHECHGISRWCFHGPWLYWLADYHTCEDVSSEVSSSEQACVVIACALGDQELVLKGLAGLDSSLNRNHLLGRPLQAAIWHRQGPIFDYLLERDCDVTYSGDLNALTDALLTRHYEILPKLLGHDYTPEESNRSGVRISENGYINALAVACRFDDRHAYDILLPFIQQPINQADLQYMLFSACLGGAENIAVDLVLSYPNLRVGFYWPWAAGRFRTNVSAISRFCLAEAAARDCRVLVKLLLERGAELQPYERAWYTPHCAVENAARFGHVATLQILLEALCKEEEDGLYGVREGEYWAKRGPSLECLKLVEEYLACHSHLHREPHRQDPSRY